MERRQREQKELRNSTTTQVDWDYLYRISPGIFLVLCAVIVLAFLVWAQVEFGIFGFFREYLFG